MAKGDLWVAKDSGMIVVDGERFFIHKGETRVADGHPMLKGNEDLFEKLTATFTVEDTTARPTQKRTAPKKS